MTAAQVSIVVLVVVMILYATEVIPLAVTAMGSCAAMAVLGLAPSGVVWAGLASDTTLVVGGMIVVGVTLIETGVARSLGDWIIRATGGKPVLACSCVLVAALLLSGFMNNSATVSTMLPVMIGVTEASNGKVHKKHWLLPMAAATNAGGMLTLIGTTSQMIVQSSLTQHGYGGFGFFDFAWIGVPLSLFFLLYMATAGKWLAKRIWKPETLTYAVGEAGADCDNMPVRQTSLPRQALSVAILVAAVVCMVVDTGIPNGTIAMTAAACCLLTRCISLSAVYRKFDWTTVFVLAGGIGFANGLDHCGGGRLIADGMISLLDGALTPKTVFIIFVVTATILTQFMSNTAVAAMLTPIAIPFVELVGISPFPLLMGICAATNLSFSTPIATPSMTLVLGPGEYKFSDYAKWCGPFNVFSTIVILVICATIWPLTA